MNRINAALAGALLTVALPAMAHHGTAQEFEPDFEAQLSAAAKSGYAVRAVTLEARGLCPACQAA